MTTALFIIPPRPPPSTTAKHGRMPPPQAHIRHASKPAQKPNTLNLASRMPQNRFAPHGATSLPTPTHKRLHGPHRRQIGPFPRAHPRRHCPSRRSGPHQPPHTARPSAPPRTHATACSRSQTHDHPRQAGTSPSAHRPHQHGTTLHPGRLKQNRRPISGDNPHSDKGRYICRSASAGLRRDPWPSPGRPPTAATVSLAYVA